MHFRKPFPSIAEYSIVACSVVCLLAGCSQTTASPGDDHHTTASALSYGSHTQSAVQITLVAAREPSRVTYTLRHAERVTRAPTLTGDVTRDGPLKVTDRDGRVLVAAALPRVRWEVESPATHSTPERDRQFAISNEQKVVITLPWPEGATSVQLERQRIAPVSMRAIEGNTPNTPTPEPIFESGPSDHRFDIVVMGDGYTSADLDTLRADARRFWERAQEIEPLKTFRDRINVWVVAAPSNQGEVGNSQGADTAYGCYYNCDGVERAICCDPERVHNHASLIPSHEGVLVIIRDDRWGGAARPNYATTFRGDLTPEVAVHELGHQAIWLGDEYSYGVTGTPSWGPIPNCSVSATQTPWDYWRGREGIGVHPHCGYTNYHKPVPDGECMMHSVDKPMCAVCREAWAREIAEASATGDWPAMTLLSATPEASAEAMEISDSLTLQASVQVPAAPAFAVPRYDWTLGAEGLPAPGDLTYQVGACGIAAGEETPLSFDAYFAPIWVRPSLAPATVPKASTSWRVRRADNVQCQYLFLPNVQR